ncbi:helix-turn-helix domain-containing protein [Shinella zoogloeoides]|uniref:helix-turn-helix domain-containing protein n=1 Tax=Shinella zoogloeoides TaxID=352475 RepID=UPI001F577C7F|nr:helix-turn-helix domain-containing protein [Shinella zoogloeoides]
MKLGNDEVVDAVRVGNSDAGRVVGQSLRALRQAIGLSQLEIANQLGVQRATISNIENHGDVQISHLEQYVRALGASLRIDATFSKESGYSEKNNQKSESFDEENDQYRFSLLDNTQHDKKEIILSIKPFYSEKILDGRKTIELRRRFPTEKTAGSKIYIYSTSPVMALVGTAELCSVERLPLSSLWKKHGSNAYINKSDFDHYFDGVSEGFALRILNPREFVKPLTLSELKERFGFQAPQSFLYAKPDLQKALRHEHINIPD